MQINKVQHVLTIKCLAMWIPKVDKNTYMPHITHETKKVSIYIDCMPSPQPQPNLDNFKPNILP
jgi:hypothetical protein